VRSGAWKLIASPKPELFNLDTDPGEQANAIAAQPEVAKRLDSRVARYSADSLSASTAVGGEAAQRLRALGYTVASPQSSVGSRPDPKDRRELASRMAQVTSGELSGAQLLSALEEIVKVDAANGQAHLRLGFALIEAGNCTRAEQEFTAAINGGLPGADAHLGLATCLGRSNDVAGAERVLREAQRREPDNPVIAANLGLVYASRNDWTAAIRELSSAIAKDPSLLEARFNLALVYATAGRRPDAAAAARDLLSRLPANAPQRSEVERLLKAVQ
jgi:Flp pilus assembly protein TadD